MESDPSRNPQLDELLNVFSHTNGASAPTPVPNAAAAPVPPPAASALPPTAVSATTSTQTPATAVASTQRNPPQPWDATPSAQQQLRQQLQPGANIDGTLPVSFNSLPANANFNRSEDPMVRSQLAAAAKEAMERQRAAAAAAASAASATVPAPPRPPVTGTNVDQLRAMLSEKAPTSAANAAQQPRSASNPLPPQPNNADQLKNLISGGATSVSAHPVSQGSASQSSAISSHTVAVSAMHSSSSGSNSVPPLQDPSLTPEQQRQKLDSHAKIVVQFAKFAASHLQKSHADQPTLSSYVQIARDIIRKVQRGEVTRAQAFHFLDNEYNKYAAPLGASARIREEFSEYFRGIRDDQQRRQNQPNAPQPAAQPSPSPNATGLKAALEAAKPAGAPANGARIKTAPGLVVAPPLVPTSEPHIPEPPASAAAAAAAAAAASASAAAASAASASASATTTATTAATAATATTAATAGTATTAGPVPATVQSKRPLSPQTEAAAAAKKPRQVQQTPPARPTRNRRPPSSTTIDAASKLPTSVANPDTRAPAGRGKPKPNGRPPPNTSTKPGSRDVSASPPTASSPPVSKSPAAGSRSVSKSGQSQKGTANKDAEDEYKDVVRGAGIDLDGEEEALAGGLGQSVAGFVNGARDDDAAFLARSRLENKLKEITERNRLDGIDESCIEFLSLAVHERLSNVMEGLAKIAESHSPAVKSAWNNKGIRETGSCTRDRLQQLQEAEERELTAAVEKRREDARKTDGGGETSADAAKRQAAEKAVAEAKKKQADIETMNDTLRNLMKPRRKKKGGDGVAPRPKAPKAGVGQPANGSPPSAAGTSQISGATRSHSMSKPANSHQQPISLRDCLFLFEREHQMAKSALLYRWHVRLNQ